MKNMLMVIMIAAAIASTTASYADDEYWEGAGLMAVSVLSGYAVNQIWKVKNEPVSFPYQNTVAAQTITPKYIVVQQAPRSVDTKDQAPITLGVPTSTGGIYHVTMYRSGQGFMGPQGEFYQQFPTVETLRAVYGR